MVPAGENKMGAVLMAAVMILILCNGSFASEAGKPSLSQAMSHVKIFSELTPAEKDALQSVATLRRMKAGENLTKKGMVLDKMFVILDGRAEVRVSGKLITTLSGQFVIGETEYLDNHPVFADVTLLKEADVVELNNAGLTVLMSKQPRIGYVLMREFARIEGKRLRDTTTAAGRQKCR